MLLEGAESSFLRDWKVASSVGSRKDGSSSGLGGDAFVATLAAADARRCGVAMLESVTESDGCGMSMWK